VTDDRVRIPGEAVEDALRAAPSSVTIFDRTGEEAFRLAPGHRTRFGIGVTNLYYQDPMTDEVMPFRREHMTASVRLANSLSHIDLVSTIGILQDTEPQTADLYATLEMVCNTTKPLVLLVSDEEQFLPIVELLEQLRGDLDTQPFAMLYVNPITPLVINEATSDKLLDAAERGLPVIVSNYGMAGMSAPITPIGMLVLLNAELLASLTLVQSASPGAPTILGSLPLFFDMREMVPMFDPVSFALNLACAEMMAFYELPHCGTSGSGTGWGPDVMSAGTIWANHLTSCMGKVGLCPFTGSNFESKAFSPPSAVYSDEVIGQALRLREGFDVTDEALDLASIDAVGPGGSFLGTDQTFHLFRDGTYRSDVFRTYDLETWQAEGQPRASTFLREHACRLLDQPVVPDDHDDLLSRGEAFISALPTR
jgi:trimethylamine--corrinoid protein Co-methyltransferase